jgi:hypothetical protein
MYISNEQAPRGICQVGGRDAHGISAAGRFFVFEVETNVIEAPSHWRDVFHDRALQRGNAVHAEWRSPGIA